MKAKGIKRTSRGFALIITLMLMIMLTILAVGLLTLSAVTLRATRQGEALATARGNARLALMLAIGDIQKQLGPDQKITAVSAILNPADASDTSFKQPNLTGVWNSRREALGSQPDYDSTKAFVQWLVSSSNPEALRKSTFAPSGDFDHPVLMVAAHGSVTLPTCAGRVTVAAPHPGLQGGLAWWVADENCKGFTNPADSLALSAGAAAPDVLAAAGSPGAYGMLAIDPSYPANTETTAKVLSHGQLNLASAAAAISRDGFHELSPYSQGLLTNVVKGGWRHDLNLYLEQTGSPFPWLGTAIPSAIGPNGKYALSTIDDYDVLCWKMLYNYYHLKDRIEMTGGRPVLNAVRGPKGTPPDDLTNPGWNSGVLRPYPVLVRAQVFIAFGSIKNPNADGTPANAYLLRFYAYPVITLWNPYNVDLTVKALEMSYLFTGFPMEHKIFVNGTFRELYNWRTATGDGFAGSGLTPTLKNALVLKAGEAKMLTATSYNWDPSMYHHYRNEMEEVPFIYSQSLPGSVWGAGGNHDGKLITTGAAADLVKLETTVTYSGAYVAQYMSTFDIRGQSDGSGTDGNWPPFQWSSKMGWLFKETTPAIALPYKSTINPPSAKFEEILNAPKPFMVIDVQLKALDEADLPNKTWRDNIPNHPYQAVSNVLNDATPYFASAYKLKFANINSYQEASSYLQIAPDNPIHTYFGGSHFPAGGQSWITDREIPLAPFTSLAQLQHLAQSSGDNLYASGFHFQNRAIGNSFASPGVPADQVKTSGWPFCLDMWTNTHGGNFDGTKYARDQFHTRPNIDRSYAANQLLWDDYFFSSMAAKSDVLRGANAKKTLAQVVKGFFENGTPLPNERYKPSLDKPAAEIVKSLITGSQPTANSYKEVAANLLVDGAFNINSTSVTAWKTMLAAAHRKQIVTMEATGKPAASKTSNYLVSRFSMPNGPAIPASGSAAGSPGWQGYHELTETQIGELAEAIVRQVKQRGPFRSLAEFINRRLGPEADERTQYGALQAALEDPKVSINAAIRGSEITAADIKDATYQNKSAALGPRYQGSPPYVTQADLLNAMSPVLAARSDTFLVRAYGQSSDANGKVLARAWCEAVVQRSPAYVDPKDAAKTLPSTPVNKLFGRRFNLVCFRWLNEREL